MIAIPAVDLRDGACVQLVGGSYADERVRLSDPLAVARRWAALGFRVLHVVDLDAATGAGSNRAIVDTIVRESGMAVQVGGGIRSTEQVDVLFAAGAYRVVVGTRALDDAEWIAERTRAYPGRIVAAVDVRAGRVAVGGWKRSLDRRLDQAVESFRGLPLAGVLVTAVDVEGRLDGPDLPLLEDAIAASPFPVIASGGITTIEDLRAIGERGAAGAVIGMALYTGKLDAQHVAAEFR